MKKHNFSAGPCILPASVLEKASNAVINFDNLDLSLLEISHRSGNFVSVMEHAKELALEHLGLQNKGYSCVIPSRWSKYGVFNGCLQFFRKKSWIH